MSDNTGGPAFPTEVVTTNDGWIHSGMTLRDYFAAKAMQAVYAKNWDMFMDETYETPEEAVKGVALDAYELADAMLKAREQ
jgi:hypothetical protein